MDHDAVKRSIRRVMDILPPDLTRVLGTEVVAIIKRDRDKLAATLPTIRDEIMPIVQTAFAEYSMSCLDQEGLEKACMEALAEYVPGMTRSAARKLSTP